MQDKILADFIPAFGLFSYIGYPEAANATENNKRYWNQ